MKAIILAAGMGKRMQPLTLTTAKPLLRIGEHSLIEHNIYSLAKSGFHDLVINLHHFGSKIMQHLGSGERYGVKIVYSQETELLDTAGGICNALNLLGKDPFAVINADVFTDYDFSKLTGLLPQAGHGPALLGHLVLTDNPEHHPEGDFALSIEKKNGFYLLDPEEGNRLTYTGISVLHPDLFDNMIPGKLPLRDLFPTAIKSGQMSGEHYRGNWTDVGTPDRLEALRNANSQFNPDQL